jgi:hypothetical protein
MDCDAGSSRGDGLLKRGDSAPGLPRGVAFGSRAGGSGSLRSPFVDVDSPSLPMVTARSRRRLGGTRAAQRPGVASGSAAACAAPQRLGGARAVRSGWAGGAPRRAAAVVSGQLFSHRAWGDSCRVPELSALKGLYNMRHSLIAMFGEHLCPKLR